MFRREIEFESINSSLSLLQEVEGDVGCVVWDAALVLSKFLEKQSRRDINTDGNPGTKNLIKGHRVLELGSGTGCVGLAASLLGASHVTLTDLPEIIPLIKKNINENCSILKDTVEVKELTWGNFNACHPLEIPDIILVADCIYYEKSLQPLVETLEAFCGPSTTIFLSYEERTSGNKQDIQNSFFDMIQNKFKIEKIGIEHHHELFHSNEIHIFKLELLSISITKLLSKIHKGS